MKHASPSSSQGEDISAKEMEEEYNAYSTQLLPPSANIDRWSGRGQSVGPNHHMLLGGNCYHDSRDLCSMQPAFMVKTSPPRS